MSYWPALSAAGAQQGPRSVRERQGGSPRPLWCWPLTCALLLGGACHEGSPAAPPDAAVSIPADLSAAQPDLLVPIPGVPAGAVAINEVHATNLGGLLDEDGDPEDWIELVNQTDQPVDLTGVGLSTSSSAPYAWTFPEGAALPARGSLLVFASKKNRAVWGRPLHSSFNIDSGADRVYLTSPDKLLLDSAAPPRTKVDVSWCRVPDRSGPFQHCTAPTPRQGNAGPAFPSMLAAPTVSVPGGFYTTTQIISLASNEPGAEIHYTLDGSDPTRASALYASPLTADETRLAAPNAFALVNTSRQSFYAPQDSEVYKATVVRAAAFSDSKLSSPITTHTYFVDPNGAGRYAGARIAAITADPPQLFNPEGPRGIYVIGPSPGASPWYPGANWWLDREVQASLELFRTDRSTAFRTDFGVQISGAYSRGYAQKNLDVIFRDPYGVKSVSAPLFPNRSYTKQKRFRLRASGNEFGRSGIRDAFTQQLFVTQDSPVDAADYAPVITFLDGEYWGFTQLREKTTGDYLEQVHGVDPDNVDIIDIVVSQLSQSDTVEVRDGNRLAFDALRAYVASHAAAIQADYGLVKSLVDVENMASWFAANVFVHNNDWPHNNARLWRERRPDARWRFTLHDDDFAFGFSANPDANLYPAIGNSSKLGTLMGQLMKNPEFRTLYINVVADQLNTHFDQANMLTRLDELLAVVEPLMPEHFARFRPNGSTLATFNSEIAKIRNFILAREAFYVRNTQTYFGLGTQARYVITLNVNDVAMGTLKINTVDLSRRLLSVAQPWQGRYFPGVPITVTALPRPGYRFVSWQGPTASNQASVTLTLSADTALTALFEKDPAPPPPPPPPPATPAGLRNVALGAAATQSSTAGAAAASLAVDGDRSGAPAAGSLALTNSEANPWWQVDLGRAVDIHSAQLYNRTDCCGERMSNVVVLVSEQDMTGRSYSSLLADPAITRVQHAPPMGERLVVPLQVKGRYLRVQLAETNALSLSEVQVLALPTDPLVPDQSLLRNLALGRKASQSSEDQAGAAARAVDGDPDGSFAAGTTTLTQTEAAPWWEVDLGERHALSSVVLWNRTDCCASRLAGFTVFVSSAPMAGRSLAELTADSTIWRRDIVDPVGLMLRIPTETVGRYVRVQLKGAGALSLAEVAVLGLVPPAQAAGAR